MNPSDVGRVLDQQRGFVGDSATEPALRRARPSACLVEAQVLAEDYRRECNAFRPHRSLGNLTPAEYAAS